MRLWEPRDFFTRTLALVLALVLVLLVLLALAVVMVCNKGVFNHPRDYFRSLFCERAFFPHLKNMSVSPNPHFDDWIRHAWHVCGRAGCQDFIPPPPSLRRQSAVDRFEPVAVCVACSVCGDVNTVTLHLPTAAPPPTTAGE